MPRYKYQCTECQQIVSVFHGINEVLLDCSECQIKETMQKILSVPIIAKKNKINDKKQKIGNITKHYIEENRNILEKQKKELKEEEHEPS